MKTRQADYAPWLLGQTVSDYCDQSVMPSTSEIDNVSLSALKDVLLSPAGISLEILYLDRSEGDEVTLHRFDPVNCSGVRMGSIRLLYRPGHYDILYKAEDIFPPPGPVPTYLQYSSQPHQDPVYDLGVSDFMTMIPGMSYANASSGWVSGSYASDFFTTSAVSQSTQPTATPVTPAPQSQIQAQAPQYVPALSTPMAPPTQFPQEMAIRTVPQATLTNSTFQQQLSSPFRHSVYAVDPEFVHATSQTPFQTSIFKK